MAARVRAPLRGSTRSGLPLPLPLLLLLAGLLVLALLSLSRRVDDPDTQRLSRSSSEGEAATADIRGRHASASSVSAAAAGPLRLMLASHGRVMWYYPGTNTSVVLHEGGVSVGIRLWNKSPFLCSSHIA